MSRPDCGWPTSSTACPGRGWPWWCAVAPAPPRCAGCSVVQESPSRPPRPTFPSTRRWPCGRSSPSCAAPSTSWREPRSWTPADVVEILTSPVGGADAVTLRRLRRALRRLELEDGGGRPSDVLLAEAVLHPFPPRPRRARGGSGPAHEPGPCRRRARPAARRPVSRRSSGRCGARAASRGRGGRRPWREGRVAAVPTATSTPCSPCSMPRPGSPTASPGPPRGTSSTTSSARTSRGTRSSPAHRRGSRWLWSPRRDRPAGSGTSWSSPGCRTGCGPTCALRGSLLGSSHLVDVVTGRGADPRAARAQVRHDETRLFHVAVTRARQRLVVTAVRSEEEQPSPYLDVVDPLSEPRRFTDVPRPATLPGLVAELRREVAGDDPATRGAAVTALATLAVEGVPGADPAQWWALRDLTDDRPRRPPSAPVTVAPSTIDQFGRCRLQWVLRAAGGDGPSMGAQDIGTLVHEVAHDLGDTDAVTYAGELERRWGRLGLAPGWLSRRDLARARAMTDRLARHVAEASAAGWRRAATEAAMAVAVGRARGHRAGRPRRGRCRRPGADHRPEDGGEQADGRGAAPARAARGLPAGGRGGRLRGSTVTAPVGRPFCSSGGRRAPARRCSSRLPGGGRRARVGSRPRRGGGCGDGWSRLRRNAGTSVRNVPAQGLLPRLRRRAIDCEERRHGIRGAVPWGTRAGGTASASAVDGRTAPGVVTGRLVCGGAPRSSPERWARSTRPRPSRSRSSRPVAAAARRRRRGIGEDGDHGGAGRVAGGERARPPRRGAGTHLHPQGGG